MEHAEYLTGQLRLQDVLNVDLKVETVVAPALGGPRGQAHWPWEEGH